MTAGRSNSSPSRMAASVEYPAMPTSVFTDGRSEPTILATAALCGAVTFAPAKPSAASPRAANAAFCIRGESECSTGWPSNATYLVAVEMLVVDEVSVVGGEVVMALVRLPHEVQVVDVRRIGRRLDGG